MTAEKFAELYIWAFIALMVVGIIVAEYQIHKTKKERGRRSNDY